MHPLYLHPETKICNYNKQNICNVAQSQSVAIKHKTSTTQPSAQCDCILDLYNLILSDMYFI